MSMHLERGLSTTSTKKRKEKMTKARLAELDQGWRDRNVRLKQMSLPKETFEQYLEWVYGKGKKAKGPANIVTENSKANAKLDKAKTQIEGKSSNHVAGITKSHSVKPWITGACTTKPSPTYTGNKVVGIATMHKSNAVPIFSDDEAKEVSSMRR